MAQNTTVTLTPNTWTQLTNADAASVTVQNQGSLPVRLKATVGATAPTDDLGAVMLDRMDGLQNLALASCWLGVSGANRLYAYCNDANEVFISHA